MTTRAALVAALALGACSDPGDAPTPYLGLDCALPFVPQVATIARQHDLIAAHKDPAEPYRFYSSADGRTSYLITEAGAPGHPAIMMQRARNGQVVTTGCPYGDHEGYQQLHAYLDSLKHWTRK